MYSEPPAQQPPGGVPLQQPPSTASASSPYQAPPGYPFPYYQQPYPGPFPPPAAPGYNGEVIAGLGYLFFLVGLIMFFAEQHNRFVKFHAAQSLLIHLAALVTSLFWILLFLVVTVTGAVASVGTGAPSGAAAVLVGIAILIVTLFALALYVLYLVAIIWGMIAAFSGQATKLPLVGDLAERWSGGPVAGRVGW